MKSFTINNNDAGQRLDKFIKKVSVKLPNSLMYKSIRTKNIKVNRKRCQADMFLNEGDVVDIYLSDEFFIDYEGGRVFHSIPFDTLAIAYEDENFVIADKPAFVICHGENSLLSQVQSYLFDKGEYDPKREQSFSPALCNRIDYSTSGLVIVAKNSLALREMDKAIAQRLVHKKYRCKVSGVFPGKSGTFTVYLKKGENNKVDVSKTPKDGYKEAVTKYKYLGDNEVELELITGRTHQIRATLAYIGCPIVGDIKYGGIKNSNGMLLCSYSISFDCQPPLDYLNKLKPVHSLLWR
ncbi:MAG: RluA family pseudouridine synthase [Oscillospiraceae bacterium]|nr:RluA family pseudouridine synthase [Oscillospiraceae bacterium]